MARRGKGNSDDTRSNVKIKAATLILDYRLYPRHEIDATNVKALVRALDAGETLPAIIIDRDSRRVVDGFHRVTAVLRHAGEDANIDAIEHDYANESELLLDAIRSNSAHGVRLSRYDQARCIALAEDAGISHDELAAALHLSADALSVLHRTKTAYDNTGTPIEIKHTAAHLAGRKLSKRQQGALEKAGGMKVRYYADQVTNALAGDLVDWNDQATVTALEKLYAALGKHLEQPAA
jgi:hypothetical protein